jgi:hypothetical protein
VIGVTGGLGLLGAGIYLVTRLFIWLSYNLFYLITYSSLKFIYF